MKIKLNKDFDGMKAGNIIELKTDETGMPLVGYWRKRIIENAMDSLFEILKEKPKKSKKTSSSYEE